MSGAPAICVSDRGPMIAVTEIRHDGRRRAAETFPMSADVGDLRDRRQGGGSDRSRSDARASLTASVPFPSAATITSIADVDGLAYAHAYGAPT
jgi:hypothetical protein